MHTNQAKTAAGLNPNQSGRCQTLPFAAPSVVALVTTLIVWSVLHLVAATPSTSVRAISVATRSAGKLPFELRPNSVRKRACRRRRAGLEHGRRQLSISGADKSNRDGGQPEPKPEKQADLI